MNKTNKVGVVVGRFQTTRLHEGHRAFLDTVKTNSDQMLIVLGVTGGWSSERDPLDFSTRSKMLKGIYPDATVIALQDFPTSNEVWSKNLDEAITREFPCADVTLYGSRDSFLPFYTGKFATCKIEAVLASSSTLLRREVGGEVRNSEDFRAGAIYAATTQNLPTSFQTVDLAMRHSLEPKVLLGRKHGETLWRFPGGFVGPDDVSLERAVKREAREELGDIEVDDVQYITSMRIDDPRYRQSQHKVMTALFSGVYIFGRIEAKDDLEEVSWHSFDTLVENLILEHRPLGRAYLSSLKKEEGALQ